MLKCEELLKKYADEIEIVKQFPDPIFPMMTRTVRKPVISMKDNYLGLLRTHRPQKYIATMYDYTTVIPKVFPDNTARALTMDVEPLTDEERGGLDCFGVEWVYVPQVGGSMVKPGNPKIKDIEHWEDYITFPDLSQYDWKTSAEKNEKIREEGLPHYAWIMNGLFERLISFMDFEDAAVALIDEDQKEGVHRLFDKLCDMYDQLIGIWHDEYHADVLYFHDDWGSQRAPFFSLEVCKEMLMPYLKRVSESAHKRGMRFDFHCCGMSGDLVPAMIGADVDVWLPNPMNDYDKLYQLYSDKILLGIPIKNPGMEASDQEIYDICLEYMEKYSENPVIVVFDEVMEKGINPRQYDILYCMSREMYQ